MGLNNARGTLFYEFARVVDETKPLICIGENVKGPLNHDEGRTLEGMRSILDEIGYKPIDPRILKAIFYNVTQKRERLILVGIRKDIEIDFSYPKPYKKIYTLKDALKAGELFPTDVPGFDGGLYPKKKREILDTAPPGGYWRDFPLNLQNEFIQKKFLFRWWKDRNGQENELGRTKLNINMQPSSKSD